jgi:sarcosine oxidase gamma subunit
MNGRDFTDGLRELADYLDERPELIPSQAYVGARVSIHIHRDTEEEARAEVDRLAAILGVPAEFTTPAETHYEAIRKFGPHEYTVITITRAHMQRYSAHMDKFRDDGEAHPDGAR